MIISLTNKFGSPFWYNKLFAVIFRTSTVTTCGPHRFGSLSINYCITMLLGKNKAIIGSFCLSKFKSKRFAAFD